MSSSRLRVTPVSTCKAGGDTPTRTSVKVSSTQYWLRKSKQKCMTHFFFVFFTDIFLFFIVMLLDMLENFSAGLLQFRDAIYAAQIVFLN